MRFLLKPAAIAFLGVLAACVASHSVRAAADALSGEIEMTVRGPDAKPLANTEIVLVPIDRRFGDEKRTEQSATTDDKGLVRFNWPAGAEQRKVIAKGIGYGFTGIIETRTGQRTPVALPPLAPFATLEGSIPAELQAPELVLKARNDADFSDSIDIPIDAAGHFRAQVESGHWYVWLVRDKQHVADGVRRISLAPGQKSEPVTFRKLPPAERVASTQAYVEARPGQDQELVWASGVVTDESGKPIGGAAVFAYAVYHGGIRMYAIVKKTTSDAQGHYEIRGEGGLSTFSASLVACVKGKPPAWAWIQGPPSGGLVPVGTPMPKAPPAPKVNLTVPDRGGTLEVTIVRDGKPAAGAFVGIWQEGVNLRDQWAAGGGGEEAQELEAFLHPIGKTDENGVARFGSLLPGRYQIIGTVAQDQVEVRRLHEHSGSVLRGTTIFGTADGVPVRAGQVTTHRLAVFPRWHAARIQFLNPDGNGPPVGHLAYDYGMAGSSGGWSTGLQVTPKGFGDVSFETPGLWRIELKSSDKDVTRVPLDRDGPCNVAQTVLAISELLPADKIAPARMTARPNRPGSVVVELKDNAGKSMRGTVIVGSERGAPVAVGSMDETGTVRFQGVRSGKHFVRGYSADRPPIDLGYYEAPLPEDGQLQNVSEIVPQVIETAPNTDVHVVLRQTLVGYVRGTLKPPSGRKTGDFNIYLGEKSARTGASIHYRPSTGEYVAGPFSAGVVQLKPWYQGDQIPGCDGGISEVTVEAGKVFRLDLHPQLKADIRQPGQGSLLIGVGGAEARGSGVDLLTGRVFLPGGKAPALGARVMYFEPGRWEPVLGGITDASGEIRAKGMWYSANAPSAQPPDVPAGPIIAACLPGSHGVVLVAPPPQGKPLEMMLPRPTKLTGRVTVGGKSPSGVPASIRVFASYEGKEKGRLGDQFNVQTTAQEDGSFELAGLTSGPYTVQAALDDIWLSPSVAVEIGGDEINPVTLAIPAPGGPAVVQVVNAAGKPVVGQTITVARPAGPLTTALWPAEWRTDGAGEARIPALETGHHVIQIKGTTIKGEIEVPTLPAVQAAPLTLRVSVPVP